MSAVVSHVYVGSTSIGTSCHLATWRKRLPLPMNEMMTTVPPVSVLAWGPLVGWARDIGLKAVGGSFIGTTTEDDSFLRLILGA